MLQIIPVVNPAMLSHYNTWVPYSEPENVGTYQYQAVEEPMGAMGTNTAFMGTHDGAHVGWQTARRRQAGLKMVPFNALSHYDTWVPNEEAASSFYPVPHAHVDNAGMGTNDAFLGSSDGAHTGWQTARAPTDKSLAKLKVALNQQLHYVSTGAGNAQAMAIFDDIQESPHGANNHHLHKIAKHTPKDKSPKQSLHYVSGADGAAGVGAIFDGIAADKKHGANNHGLHKIAKHTPKDKSTKQSLHYVSGADGAAGVSAIFDGIATDKRHGANNHGLHKIAKHTPKDKAPKQSLHYVSGADGAAGVGAIFDGIAADKKHGANNHGLHKIAKHTPKDKATKQSLHYVSGADGAAGVSAIFDGIATDKKHGANNHGLHKIAKHTPKD